MDFFYGFNDMFKNISVIFYEQKMTDTATLSNKNVWKRKLRTYTPHLNFPIDNKIIDDNTFQIGNICLGLMLPVFLDFPSLVAPSAFCNVYLQLILHFNIKYYS
jgi:hypothetical protein